MSESTALIPVQRTPEPNDSILPLARKNTLAVMHNGPGLSMLQLARFGGKAIEAAANYYFSGPKGPKSSIEDFFGDDGKSQAALDNLYHHNRQHPSSRATHKQHKALRNHCHKLLSYARPQAHTVDTQLVTFKILVAIIPRYPGLRVLFRDHKDLKDALLSHPEHLWTRDQDCGKEWIFYRDLAVFCISEGPLTLLVENELPSDLGRLELVGDNLNRVPTETLLASCRSGPEFDPPRLCAIRYLAGILEPRSFWLQGKDYPTRLYDVFSDICDTMLKLIEDAEIDMPDEDCLLLPWLSAARDGLDILACFALDGLLLLESIGCFPHCPPQLPKIISLLLRDKQKTHPHFPKASAAASAVDSILEHAPLQDTESEDAGEGQAMFAEHHRQASVVSPDGASTISRASSAGDPGPFSGADAAIMADAFRKALRKPEFEGRPVDEGESLKTDNPDATAGELAEEGRDIRNPSGSSALGRDADAKAGDPGPFSGADAAIMADAFRKALRKPDFAGRPV